MEQLGGRVTVGDVAATAGVTISEAEEALNALAADCNASIQVAGPRSNSLAPLPFLQSNNVSDLSNLHGLLQVTGQ